MDQDVVRHYKYGRGLIRNSRFKGFELLVAFDDGVTRWVRVDELLDTSDLLQKEELRFARSYPLFTEEHLKSRRMIEAFRLGIVPYDSVEQFTFGRDKEIKAIGKWLGNKSDSALFIVGEYGSGKSHLLNYACRHAIERGFAVSIVEMDPNESPFYKPKRVYGRLAENIRYINPKTKEIMGFHELLGTAFRHGAFEDHTFFRYLLDDINNMNLWDWVQAREAAIRPWNYYDRWLPGLYDYTTAANIYCYLLSGLGWAAKEILGLKGLLLLFDEAEIIEHNYYNYQAEKAKNFLRALIKTAQGADEMLQRPSWRFGLDYCGVGDPIPFLYRQPSGLKLLFAFTSLDWNDQTRWVYKSGNWEIEHYHIIEDFASIPRLDLEHLTDKALLIVFENICLLYDSAYDFLEDDLAIETIFGKTAQKAGYTRMFVKGAVEALDIVRLNDSKKLGEALG